MGKLEENRRSNHPHIKGGGGVTAVSEDTAPARGVKHCALNPKNNNKHNKAVALA